MSRDFSAEPLQYGFDEERSHSIIWMQVQHLWVCKELDVIGAALLHWLSHLVKSVQLNPKTELFVYGSSSKTLAEIDDITKSS